MKKVLIILLILVSAKVWADDTATIQNGVNAGNYLLPNIGRPYVVSAPITCTHSINLNGQTINSTQVTDAVFKITAANVAITNGNIFGSWDFTTAPNPTSGGYCIRVLANNFTADHLHIANFASYGILCGNYNSPIISNNLIEKTGYIGFYYDSEGNNSTGGTVYNNTFDRSMLSPTSVTEADVEIRATVSAPLDTISNWTINQNIFKMPNLPSSSAAECIEVRHMTNSTISHNVLYNGSIGISIVGCARITANNNQTSAQKFEGIELADSHNCSIIANSINGSQNDGILLDGGAGCRNNTFTNDTVQNVLVSAIHEFIGTKLTTINGGVYSHRTKGLIIQQSDSTTLNRVTINGNSASGSDGIFLNNSPGNLWANNCSIIYNNCVVFAYNTQTNASVDNIHFVNLISTGSLTNLCSNFSNGAHYGTNITFIHNTLNFPPIASKMYGFADFDPGATSPIAITYTSSNTSVAQIVLGKIHIIGAGSSNITAANTDTSAVQPFTVTKAPLTITADSKVKSLGSANPALTATYFGFVYSDIPSNLTTQPTLSTTANTSSPAGSYPITPSGAVSGNYTFTYVNGVLVVTGEHGPITRRQWVLH